MRAVAWATLASFHFPTIAVSLSTATNGRLEAAQSCPPGPLFQAKPFPWRLGSGTLTWPCLGVCSLGPGSFQRGLGWSSILHEVTARGHMLVHNDTTTDIELSLTLKCESYTKPTALVALKGCVNQKTLETGSQSVLPELESSQNRDCISPPLMQPRTSPHPHPGQVLEAYVQT